MSFRSANMTAHMTKFNSANSSNFIDMYEDILKDEIAAKNSQPKHKTFAPSSFRCLRISWFRIRGVQPDSVEYPDIALDFSAKIGTCCHEIIQERLKSKLGSDWIDVSEYLKESSFEYSYTVENKGYETMIQVMDPPVRFACDGIIKFNNTLYLLEIKTSDFASFNDLTGPKDKHIDQIRCYASLLNIENVLVLYQDRTYGSLKCFEIKVPLSDRLEVKRKMMYVLDRVESNIAPEGLPKGDPQCTPSMCPYYNKCKEWGR